MRISQARVKCLLLAGLLLAGSTSAQAAFKEEAGEGKTSVWAQMPAKAEAFPVTAGASVSTQLSAKQQRRLIRKAVLLTLKQRFGWAPVGGSKSQLTALLLCFFLGAIGIHRFYLGYTLIGLLQLLAFLLLPLVILVAILAVAPAPPIITLFLIPLLVLLPYFIWIATDFVRIITGDLKPKHSSYDQML
jgi:hypothetical protein